MARSVLETFAPFVEALATFSRESASSRLFKFYRSIFVFVLLLDPSKICAGREQRTELWKRERRKRMSQTIFNLTSRYVLLPIFGSSLFFLLLPSHQPFFILASSYHLHVILHATFSFFISVRQSFLSYFSPPHLYLLHSLCYFIIFIFISIII